LKPEEKLELIKKWPLGVGDRFTFIPTEKQQNDHKFLSLVKEIEKSRRGDV
jgi:hypothetical protein